ncbi:uncharacterized protein LOC117221984 [Megalopta genalis]|uniref:uncharacterized protein LOC117221984 n=1 Tax=Megalopta genalis TaxID=115081 RepID=UPI00144370A1|nr:uncharacterized protein LOC117221984 [Megalopta genalis]
MQKKDSTDLQARIELLLQLMTNRHAEDEQTSEDSDFEESSASETEEEDEPDYADIELRNNSNETSLRLSKFFQEIDETKKYSPSSTVNEVRANTRFEKKMYRVIPMKLDPGTPKLRSSIGKSDGRR